MNRVLLISGDRDQEVRRLAHELGVTEVYAAKTPEDEIAITRQEATLRLSFLVMEVMMQPAMQAATVGVALGIQSDVTSEAVAVILETSLASVDELIHIA